MNDKTRDLQQDSEELLVTSTSSSIITESIVSLSETETTESETGVCHRVTSSTGNNSNCRPDEDDYVASTQVAIVDASVAEEKDNSNSTMGGTSNNDAETCVLPTSSNYIEQSNDNTKNMVITRSGGNSTEFNNIRTDLLITPTTSAAAVAAAAAVQNLTAPTTRSKRKLMTEGSGSVSLNRNSINLNHKSIKLDIKNHQSSMTTRKSSSVSINSLLNQDEKIKFDDKSGSSSGKPSASVLGKYQILSKTNLIDDEAGCSSNASSNKLVNKKYNCVNDLDSNDKVDESHLNKNDTTMCTMSTADDNDDSDSSRTKSPVINSCDNDDKVQIIGENRKVEPLKINLNRDTVKTKIIIKPIVRPANLMDSSDRPGSPMIPKLTIKSSNLSTISTMCDSKGTPNGSEQPPHEPHIVPKLTIRASESNSSLSNADVKHTVVPKLTIKIDGAMNCVNSSPSSASPSPPPLPKLTIKTSGDITGSIISKHSPKASSSQCHVVSTSCSISSHSPTQTTIIPKLTIKPIPKPSTSNGSEITIQSIPKLTIKPIPPPPPVLSESSCNESDCTDDAEPTEKASVPKLTIRTGIEHSVKIQHSELSNTIPKLTIRTISEQSGEPGEKAQIVPKFTIKSSVQENTQSIPKLTIAVNDLASSSSVNSPGSEKIPKLTIRQVEQDEVDRIPKLMISSVHSNDDVEKVPKLTIKQVQEIDSVEKLPKLTIRTCTESTDDLDKIPKLTIKSILESSGECSEKVPKLTIRQVPDTDDGSVEKVSKLKISSVQESDCGLHSVPKLMIKQVQEDDEKVPKLTIISKSVCEESAKIRKLKIKPVQDFSKMSGHNALESENVGRISKLEVRTTEPIDGEKIPKLMIRQVQDNDGEGKIPKITIIQSVANCQNETDKETGVFRKIKSPVRNKEDSCEEENPASKMLKLSPKNDLVNLADLSSFRKEEREREKEKEKGKEKKNEIEKKTAEENDIEHDELLDRPKSGRFHLDVVEIDDEPEDRTTNALKALLEKDSTLERDGRLQKEFLGVRVNAEAKLTEKAGSTSENRSEKVTQRVQNYALTNDTLRGSLGLRPKVPEHEGASIGKYFSNDPLIETIDLESESEACSGSQGSNNEEEKTNRKSIDMAPASEMPSLRDAADIDNDVEVIYLDQDQDSSDSISNTKTSKCTGRMSSPKLCDIPMEPPSDLLDPNSCPIESVDLTTPSPGNSPVHLVNEEINLKRHTILRRVLEESSVKDKSKDLSRMPSTSLENMLANRRDDIKHEKLFRVNCGPNSNESTQSPKNFSEQIVLDHSQNLTIPVHERLLLNSTCFRSSPFQEDQSKSTDNSSEPAHLDEKFLSNVDVLSCLGICKENMNSSTFNAVTVDDVLRRNNNKEALTVALVPPPEEIIIDDCSQESKLKRSTDSQDPLDSEAPPAKKARSDMKDPTTQNAIPDSVSLNSGLLKFESADTSKSISAKDSSNLKEPEASCDDKFRTMLGLKDFNHDNDMESISKDGKSSSGLRGVFGNIKKESDELSKSSQNASSLNLAKKLESKIVVIQDSEESSDNTKIRENLLLINEESGSDGIMADECTSDPLSNFTTPTDEKRVQEVDSGVDISSSVKSESVPETPVKRPRGRPRKDGRPAGSVKKPEKKVRESTVVIKTSGRRRSKNVSVEVEKPKEVTLGRPRKRQSLKASQAVTPEQIVEISSSPPVLDVKPSAPTTVDASPVAATPLDTTPLQTTPAESYPLDIKPLDTTPLTIFKSESTEKTENVTPSTPLRPLRGRGSRGGRISRSAGRGSRGARTGKSRNSTPRSRPRGEAIIIPATPEKEVIFFSPERKQTVEGKTPKSVKKRKTPKASPSLQVFEEDTRMSAESISTQPRPPEILNQEDTQSSIQSSTSALEGSATVKKRAKMEVTLPEGKTEYTVDMIAEYDWPPPKGCCPAKNRDTFMIQEQIAQYLGIKSFKRKYPDLPRRQIDMEERNYLREKGLVTEKMCDLGITAVWASDVLDIMYSDFYDKYEEYKNYLRQKQLRDIEAKQKALAAEAVDKGILARERALQSAAKWNSNFNKARKEDRRLCLDLQSLVIQIPSTVGKKLSRPSLTQQPPPSDYPVALVPGQFAECYRTYTPEELRCYPINTVIADTVPVSDRLRPKVECDDCSGSESESDESNSSGSDSDCSSVDSDSDSNLSTDDDEPPDDEKKKCFVCHQPQNRNLHGMPEVFIRCVTCRRRTHPSCISMPRRMVTRVRNYNWQCADCKCCIKCKRKQEENKMLFCEQCDRGYHIYCLQIKNIPEGRWHCERCAICMRCGARKPEGDLPPPTPPLSNQEDKKKSSKKKAKWVHEYKIDHLTKIREHFSILCVPCARSKASKPKS